MKKIIIYFTLRNILYKYFYNSKNIRYDSSYFIELSYFNENEKERYIFYV